MGQFSLLLQHQIYEKKNPSDVNEEPHGLSNLHFFDYSLAILNSAISTLVSCLSFICTGTVCTVPIRDLMLSIRMTFIKYSPYSLK